MWTFFCTEDRLRNQVNLRNLGYRASMDFGEFLGVALTNPHADKHTTPQSVYMGPQPFDRLARLENLGDEWAALCERFPEIRSDIEWKNKTGHADWRDYYTPKLRQRAEEVYAAGMALWAMTGESRNGN